MSHAEFIETLAYDRIKGGKRCPFPTGSPEATMWELMNPDGQ